MPLQIDPAWEYWQPDEEIAEVMNESTTLSLFDSLGIETRRIERNNSEIGYRFGQGNPDAVLPIRLGREKRTNSRYLNRRTCKSCEYTFQPKYSRQVYCSKRCRTKDMGLWWQGVGNRIKRLKDRECPYCRKRFSPKHSTQKFCSRSCSLPGREEATIEYHSNTRIKCRKVDHKVVHQLYMNGIPMKDIASTTNYSYASIKRIVRQLCPSLRRPSGAPKRGKHD